MSDTSSLIGGPDFTCAIDREHVAKVLGIDVSRIPSQNSWAYHEILEGILKGQIKGLWVVCTNTAHSWINQDYARDVLSRLDFLVVQDMYTTTETTQMADLVLPAAGWGEKDGSFINSERRIGIVRKVARAPGQALSDFSIFRLFAEAWGCGEMFREWTDPQAAFRILQRLSAGQPCDITGLGTYNQVDAAGGVQWPHAEPVGTSGDPPSAMSQSPRPQPSILNHCHNVDCSKTDASITQTNELGSCSRPRTRCPSRPVSSTRSSC